MDQPGLDNQRLELVLEVGSQALVLHELQQIDECPALEVLLVEVSHDLQPLKEACHDALKTGAIRPLCHDMPLLEKVELSEDVRALLALRALKRSYRDLGGPLRLEELGLLGIKGQQLVSAGVGVDVLLPRGGENEGLNVLHEYLLLVVASPVQLSVCLVDVRLHLSELLERPLRDVDQDFDLIPCSCI